MFRLSAFSQPSAAARGLLLLALACPFVHGDDSPPERTIRSLGELASRVELDHTRLERPDGTLTIDNQTLSACAEGGHLTTVGEPAAELPAGPELEPLSPQEESKLREKWRRRVLAQRRRVAAAEAKLRAHDAKVDAMVTRAFNQGSPRARSWLKIDELRARRPPLERSVAEARRELARIIREARQEGAQPGWFR